MILLTLFEKGLPPLLLHSPQALVCERPGSRLALRDAGAAFSPDALSPLIVSMFSHEQAPRRAHRSSGLTPTFRRHCGAKYFGGGGGRNVAASEHSERIFQRETPGRSLAVSLECTVCLPFLCSQSSGLARHISCLATGACGT